MVQILKQRDKQQLSSQRDIFVSNSCEGLWRRQCSSHYIFFCAAGTHLTHLQERKGILMWLDWDRLRTPTHPQPKSYVKISKVALLNWLLPQTSTWRRKEKNFWTASITLFWFHVWKQRTQCCGGQIYGGLNIYDLWEIWLMSGSTILSKRP